MAPPSGCRHATAEYGAAHGAHPVDWTVAVTVPTSSVGDDSTNEHGGGGGASGLACATPAALNVTAPAQAPNVAAHLTRTRIGRPMVEV